jgi:hypothetical protein
MNQMKKLALLLAVVTVLGAQQPPGLTESPEQVPA